MQFSGVAYVTEYANVKKYSSVYTLNTRTTFLKVKTDATKELLTEREMTKSGVPNGTSTDYNGRDHTF